MPGCGQCRFPPLNCVPEGAWSPIGDVTTTMLWISHKISTAGRRLGNIVASPCAHGQTRGIPERIAHLSRRRSRAIEPECPPTQSITPEVRAVNLGCWCGKLSLGYGVGSGCLPVHSLSQPGLPIIDVVAARERGVKKRLERLEDPKDNLELAGTIIWLFFPSFVAGILPLFGIWWQAARVNLSHGFGV